MSFAIPILQDHDATKPIGWLKSEADGTLTFELAATARSSTRDEFFSIFPGAGVTLIEGSVSNGTQFIRKVRICEISICILPPAVRNG